MTKPNLYRFQQLAKRCRDKSEEYLATSKSYTCKSNAELRAGIVKGAAVLKMVANWIDAEVADQKSAKKPAKAVEADKTLPSASSSDTWPNLPT